MATSGVSGQISCYINLRQVDTTNTAAPQGAINAIQLPAGLGNITITPGTGNGQCNLLWGKLITLTGSSPQTLDLRALTGPLGQVVTFSRIKILYIKSQSTTYTHKVTVGNASSNIFSGMWSSSTNTEDAWGGNVCPLLKTNLGAGWTCDATNRNLKLDPGTNTQTVEVFFAGLS